MKILSNVFRLKQALKLVTLLKHVFLVKKCDFCEFYFYNRINGYLKK